MNFLLDKKMELHKFMEQAINLKKIRMLKISSLISKSILTIMMIQNKNLDKLIIKGKILGVEQELKTPLVNLQENLLS
jgi:hypothetical protein